MGTCHLVVRAADIAGAVVHGLHVTVSFDGGDAVPLDRAEPTSFERAVPAGARRARLSLSPPDPFWPVTLSFGELLDATAETRS